MNELDELREIVLKQINAHKSKMYRKALEWVLVMIDSLKLMGFNDAQKKKGEKNERNK